MVTNTIFINNEMFRFYQPQLLSPSPWYCFKKNAEVIFGKKQASSIPAYQTLKYKYHITFRNKSSQQNNHV